VVLSQETDPGALVAPAIVAAFDGWVDAASAATGAAERILAEGEGDEIAAFDSDLLYDYRARRPVLDIVDGRLSELTWPSLALRRSRVDGRDILVLTGPEPDFRWREIGQEILELALRLGVVEWVSLGSIPAAVPHTRPVPILANASKRGLLHEDEMQGPDGLLRVPSAALSAIEFTVIAGGIPTVGFYSQVPHYVGGPYPAATISLLEHAGRHLGVMLPLRDLPDEATATKARIDAAVQADEDSRAYVARLETMTGAQGLPSGEDLATEIERFLRGQTGESGPSR
jgi:PAC2 family